MKLSAFVGKKTEKQQKILKFLQIKPFSRS